MHAFRIRQLLKLYGVVDSQIVDTGNGWLNTSCLLARFTHAKGLDTHPSFGIKIDRLQSTYYCFACQCSGTVEKLVRVLRDLTHQRNLEAEQLVQHYDCDLSAVPIPEAPVDDAAEVLEIISRCFPAEMYQRATDYLTAREIPLELIDRWGLLYDPKEDRLVMPIRDRMSGLVGVIGRAIGPMVQPRYRTKGKFRKKGVWAGLHRVEDTGSIVLVEGLFDFFKVSAGGVKNVLSSCGASVSLAQLNTLRQIFIHREAPRLHLWFDNDQAGQLAAAKIQEFFRQSSVQLFVVLYQGDLAAVKDPGDVPLEQIRPVLRQAARWIGDGPGSYMLPANSLTKV